MAQVVPQNDGKPVSSQPSVMSRDGLGLNSRAGVGVSMEGGIAGVLGNPFAAPEIKLVTVNSRKDTCFETNICCIM